MTRDSDLVVGALEAAQIILAEHIEPGGPSADMTITRLLAVLDTEELVEAMERLKDWSK